MITFLEENMLWERELSGTEALEENSSWDEFLTNKWMIRKCCLDDHSYQENVALGGCAQEGIKECSRSNYCSSRPKVRVYMNGCCGGVRAALPTLV